MTFNDEQLIEHVKSCIDKADRNESKLTDSELQIAEGWGKKIRHFLNNFCSITGTDYLEIGLHRGATTCSALKDNRVNLTGVDHWQFWGGKSEFDENIRTRVGNNIVRIIEHDCFTLTSQDLPEKKFQLYTYDADHSREGHRKALVHLDPFLADTFAYVCDDWFHPGHGTDVPDGTRDAVKQMNYKVLFERILGTDPSDRGNEGWHFGLYVAVFKKDS